MIKKIIREIKNFFNPQIESNYTGFENNNKKVPIIYNYQEPVKNKTPLMSYFFQIHFPNIDKEDFQSVIFYENGAELKYVITEENIKNIPNDGDSIDEIRVCQLNSLFEPVRTITLKGCKVKKVNCFEYFSYLYNDVQSCSVNVEYIEKHYE